MERAHFLISPLPRINENSEAKTTRREEEKNDLNSCTLFFTTHDSAKLMTISTVHVVKLDETGSPVNEEQFRRCDRSCETEYEALHSPRSDFFLFSFRRVTDVEMYRLTKRIYQKIFTVLSRFYRLVCSIFSKPEIRISSEKSFTMTSLQALCKIIKNNSELLSSANPQCTY